MGAAHARHRPRSKANDTTGMLSYQPISAPQPGQADRGAQRLRRSGRRAMTTLRKLPSTRPNTTTAASAISELMLGGHVPRRDGMQLPENRELLAHLRRLPRGPIRENEADPRLGSERLLVRGAVQLGERFVEALQTHKSFREIRARHDVVGVHCDGLPKVRLRFRESLLLIQREPEIVQRAELDRADVQRSTQRRLGFAWMTQLDERQAEAAVRFVTIGLE